MDNYNTADSWAVKAGHKTFTRMLADIPGGIFGICFPKNILKYKIKTYSF